MSTRPLLIVLASTVYLVGATEFMLAPMLTPLAEAFRTTPAHAAWLVSSYACAYAVAAPWIGLLGDRLDRRRVLLPALLVFALDGVALTLAPSLAAATLFRVIGGLASAALVPTTFALIAEVTPAPRRAGAMGLVLLGMTLGIATGPPLAGLLTARFDWRAPFLATAAGCLLAFTAARRLIPTCAAHNSSRPHASPLDAPPPHARDIDRRSTWTSLRALTHGALVRPLIAKGLWLASAVAGFLLSGELLRARAGLDTAQIGGIVSIFGLGLGAGNALVGRLERWLERHETVQLAGIALASAALVICYMRPPTIVNRVGLPPLAWPLAGLGLLGLALGFTAPASAALLTTRAGADTGLVLAVSESVNNIVLLALLPIAAALLAHGTSAGVGLLLVSGQLLAASILWLDRRWTRAAVMPDGEVARSGGDARESMPPRRG